MPEFTAVIRILTTRRTIRITALRHTFTLAIYPTRFTTATDQDAVAYRMFRCRVPSNKTLSCILEPLP